MARISACLTEKLDGELWIDRIISWPSEVPAHIGSVRRGNDLASLHSSIEESCAKTVGNTRDIKHRPAGLVVDELVAKAFQFVSSVTPAVAETMRTLLTCT